MQSFCGKCGQPLDSCTCPKEPAPAREVTRDQDHQKAPMRNMNQGGFTAFGKQFIAGPKLGDIELGEGEELVRTYDIAKHFFGHGYIRLFITNKRLVIFKEHRNLLSIHNNTEYDETNLDKVQGLQAGIDSRFSVFGILLGLLMTLVGLSQLMTIIVGVFQSMGGRFGVPLYIYLVLLVSLIVFLFGLYLIAMSVKPVIIFGVTGLGNEHMRAATVNSRTGRPSRSLLVRKLSSPFYPVQGSDKLITEAGACIFDLRTYGDEAVAKWRQ